MDSKSLKLLKPLLHFLCIPLLVILGANLFGFVSTFLIPLLDGASGIVWPVLRKCWVIPTSFVVFFLTWRFLTHRDLQGGYHDSDDYTLSMLRRELKILKHGIDGPGRPLPGRAAFNRPWSRQFSCRRHTVPASGSAIEVLWAFILICTVLAVLSLLVFLCVFIFKLLAGIFDSDVFKKYNLFFFLALIFAILQFALRRRSLQSMTWKRLGTLWMKPPTISAITIGGFGFIATSDAIKNPLLQLTLENEYTNLYLIVPTALCGLLLMVFALIAE